MGKSNLLGAWGESVAAEYLKKKRYRIISTCYRSRFGEIDLIAVNKSFLVFAEVKLRRSDAFAMGREFVDRHKQNRLRTTAGMYLSENPTTLQPRFDVIEIYAPQGIQTVDPEINHIEDAFE